MTRRYGIVNTLNNLVENVIDYETVPPNPPPGHTANFIAVQHDEADIGYQYQGGVIIIPPPPPPTALQLADTKYGSALAAGLTITWVTSTSLTDTYPLDVNTQIRMIAERLSVSVNGTYTNGTNQTVVYGITGTVHSINLNQGGLLVKTIWKYLTDLWVAYNDAVAGRLANWPPGSVTVTG